MFIITEGATLTIYHHSDILNATMNYGAHISFAAKWAKILGEEEIESAST